jgi:hypothetical protein
MEGKAYVSLCSRQLLSVSSIDFTSHDHHDDFEDQRKLPSKASKTCNVRDLEVEHAVCSHPAMRSAQGYSCKIVFLIWLSAIAFFLLKHK